MKNLPIVLIVLLFLLAMSAYTIDEREKGILFNLGKIVDTELEPGLHFKFPFINNVRKFSSQVLTLDAQPEPFLTIEKKNVIVDFFVKWQIDDVGLYYRRTQGQESVAQSRLSQVIKDGLRNEFAKRTIIQAISGERKEIMQSINNTSQELARDLGIKVVDVRISRIDLPQNVSESVYSRMRAERSRTAADFRAKGQEDAQKIRANADRQRAVIKAEAYKSAQILRGEGDASAADIYASAYSQDSDFYSFYRSLESYRKAFTSGSDVMLLDPDSDFFKYLKNSKGQ